MNILIFLSFIFSKVQIINQSFYSSEIITDEDLSIPEHCFVTGYPCLRNVTLENCNLKVEKNQIKFLLFKPLRKMHEYEYDIERGVELKSSSRKLNNPEDRILDSINYPDFSSQAIGMAVGGILLSLLFKLFA